MTILTGTFPLSADMHLSNGVAGVYYQQKQSDSPVYVSVTSASVTITASSPTLSSLSQTSVTAGEPAFVLTVNGSGFLSGSAVQWNGLTLATTYLSGAQLSASVPASLIVSQGSATVSVLNRSEEHTS